MTDTAPIVDVHAHAYLPTVERLVADSPGLKAQQELEHRRQGVPSTIVSGRMFGSRIEQLTDLDRRIDDMNDAGVDVQVVSASPSQYHYWADEALATDVYQAAHESVADLIGRQPERLRGLGLVPLQHPDLMTAALEDAVVRCGLDGIELGSHAPQGDGTVELSDPSLESFWARAAELGAVVFLHPFGCTLGERLDRSYLANSVGQPVENAVAISHLIVSGVMDRHPDLRVVAAHGGGYLPTSVGRADHAWHEREDARTCERPPSEYLRSLWFDSLVYTPAGLKQLVAAAGADRVVLGSDYPFDMGTTDPVRRVTTANLDDTTTDQILRRNAYSLFSARNYPDNPVGVS